MESRIKLNGGVKGGLLNFDGSSYATYGSSPIFPSLLGKMDMDFKLWLDKDTGFSNSLFIVNPDPSISNSNVSTCFSSFIYESSIYFGQKIIGPFQSFSIKDLDNQILDCKIRKSESTGYYIDFFSINGNIRTSGATMWVTGTFTGVGFGTGPDIASSIYLEDKLRDAVIWDIKITEVSTNLTKHIWKGYPNGDSSLGWKDQVGEINLSIQPLNDTHLRYTPLFFHGESDNILSVGGSNNKLNLGI